MAYGKFKELHRGHLLFVDYQYNKVRDAINALPDLDDVMALCKYVSRSKGERNKRVYLAVLDGWLYADIAQKEGISIARVNQIVKAIKRAIIRHERNKAIGST